MTASVNPPTRCPYCGSTLADGPVNEDHIFVKAQGGRAVVRAHKDCNSKLGSLVEGALMRPGEQLNLKTLRGHVEGDAGQPVEVDLETGEMRMRPVTTEDDYVAQTRTYTLRGDRDRVRAHLEGSMGPKLGLSDEEIDDLIRNAKPMTEPINVVAKLTFDLTLSQRLVAKVALGALGRIAPDAVASPLADMLREVLWGRSAIEERIAPEALEVVLTVMRQVGANIEPLSPQPNAEEEVASRVIFVPNGTTTAIFVYLGATLISFSGLVVDEPCPVGSGLPVMIVDAWGGIQVRDTATELAQYVSGTAPDA